MRKKTAVGLIMFMTCMSCIGCAESTTQIPETEETIVSRKDTRETTEESSTAAKEEAKGSIQEQIQAPQRYQKEFGQEGLRVSVDAPVEIPNAEGFRKWKVTARTFEQSDYDIVNQVILKGAKLWRRDDKIANGFIKEELEASIAELEEKKREGVEEIDERQIDDILKVRKALLEEAPIEPEILDVEARVPAPGEEIWLDGCATVDNEDYYVSMSNMFDDDWHWVKFEIKATGRGSYNTTLFTYDPDVSFSKEDARTQAQEMMTQMGMTDFAVAGEEYVVTMAEKSDDADAPLVIDKTGWCVHFTRVLDGIPVTYTSQPGTTMKGDVPSWPYERIDFVFDEDGLADFRWDNPYTIEPLSNEYEFLLPFTDIQNIFEEMFIQKYEKYQKSQEGRTDSFNISEIRLGYMRVIEQEGDTTGTIIPVWDFIGTYHISFEQKEDNYTNAVPYNSLLTINALDGTIIDRDFGY